MLERVVLHCATASNLELIDQTLSFDRSGTTLRIRPEGADDRHVLSALSVIGEYSDHYVLEGDLDAPMDTGRFRLRGKMIEVRPHRSEIGRRDRAATVRLRLCDGARANGLQIGALQQLRESVSGNPRLQVSNVVPTRGGSEALAYPAARIRFADLVRTRERIITEDDILIAVRAFDGRLATAIVRAAPRVRMGVLEFVDEVVVSVSSFALADPVAEPVIIRERLERHLSARWMMGRQLVVRVVVTEGSAA